MVEVTQLSWADLNELLINTTDEKQLAKWLEETVRSGSEYRALRVHGRLNAVRRQREIEDIKRKVA